MLTIPSAVKKKFGLTKTINPRKIPAHPARRNITVIIPHLRLDGVGISDFDFVALLNIKRIANWILKIYKMYLLTDFFLHARHNHFQI